MTSDQKQPKGMKLEKKQPGEKLQFTFWMNQEKWAAGEDACEYKVFDWNNNLIDEGTLKDQLAVLRYWQLRYGVDVTK